MSDPARKRMTVDEFFAWAEQQPETEHYELVHGEVVAMAPERLSHSEMKFTVARKLAEAIEGNRLDCTAYVEGPGVIVDEDTIYEPDAMVRCGPRPEGDPVALHDPLIVVEVLSRSTKRNDTVFKLPDYFSISSLRHYVIVGLKPFVVVHHRRNDAGGIETRLLPGGGLIAFDPPGFAIELSLPT
jgi:Uma2 family endonuclease